MIERLLHFKGDLPKIYDWMVIAFAVTLPVSIAGANIVGGMWLAVWMLSLCLVPSSRHWKKTGTEKAIFVFLFVSFLAAFMSSDPMRGIKTLKPEILIVLFFLTTQTISSESAKRSLKVFVIVTILAGGIGIFQYWGHKLWLSQKMTAGWFMENMFSSLDVTTGIRAVGTRSSPLTFAEGLLLGLGPALVWMIWEESTKKKILWGVGVVFLLGGIVASQTRGIWLGSITCLAVLVVMSKKKSLWLAAAISFLLLGLLIVQKKELRQRAISIVQIKHSANIERVQLWKKAWKDIKKDPIFGLGPGQFYARVKKSWNAFEEHRDPHNLYLRFWVERGAVGLAALLWLLMCFGRWMLKVETPLNWGLFSTFIGLLVAGLTESWYTDSEIAMSILYLAGISAVIVLDKKN